MADVPSGGTAAANTLTSSIDDQKKALLTALAEQGSAGRAAFDQAQQQVQAQKAAGVQAALARAGQVGAPATFTSGAEAYAGQPADTALTGLASSRATFDADIARQTARDSSYFGKVAAAVPIQQMQTDAAMAKLFTNADQASQERQQSLTDSLLQRMAAQKQREFEAQQQQAAIEAAKIAADRDSQQFQWDSEKHDWQRSDADSERQFRLQQEAYQLAQDEAQLSGARTRASSAGRGRSYAGEGTPLADLVHTLGGKGLATDQLAPYAAQYVKDNSHPGKSGVSAHVGANWGWGLPSTKYPGTPAVAAITKAQALDQLGAQLGLAPGELKKFLGKDAPDFVAKLSKGEASQQQSRISRSTTTYKNVSANLKNELAKRVQPVREKDKNGNEKKNGKITSRPQVGIVKVQMMQELFNSPDYAKHPNVYDQLIRDYLS